MRKRFSFGIVLLLLSSLGVAQARQPAAARKRESAGLDAAHALRMLKDGNRRFATHHQQHPHETVRRRIRLARSGQHPFAIVLSCSDSRVPPEIIFDEGLGDLFVVRIAGNIVDDAVIGSIEYAAEHLGAQLLVVLGHERCGAVQAAVEHNQEAHLRSLSEAIRPAVEKVQQELRLTEPETHTAQFVEKVVRENVRQSVSLLQSSEPVLARLTRAHHLGIVGATYHLSSGKVEFLP